jgi:hypothetical protein
VNKPYIGITGFVSRQEVEAMLALMPAEGRHKLMVGVLVSSKSLCGVANRWPNRYSEVEEIQSIFVDHPCALNLIHFNFKKDLGGKLSDEMAILMNIAGPACHGFQLNIPWPSLDELRLFRNEYPNVVIVLQIGSRAFERVRNPDVMASLINAYSRHIDYVLLDPSCGFGQPLNQAQLLYYLESIYQPSLGIGYGVAGGLSAGTFHLIPEIVKRYPDICIDTEGLLRDEEDRLNLDEAGDYLREALRVQK